MRFRSSSLRVKVIAVLLTMTALWAFGAWVTLRDGVNLFWVQTLNARVVQPTQPLVRHLQTERRHTQEYLGSRTTPSRKQLDETRRLVDATAEEFRRSTDSFLVQLATRPEVERWLAETFAAVDRLAATREAVDARRIDRAAAAQAFTDVISTFHQLYKWLGSLGDGQVDRRVENLVQFTRGRELAAQEDAILSGAFADTGRVTAAEHARFVQLVGTRRMLAAEAMAGLPAADQDRYRQAVQHGATARLQVLEDRIVQSARLDGQLPVSATEWREAMDAAQRELEGIELAGGAEAVDAATPVAVGTIVRVLIMAVLGLFAVIVSASVARATMRQLDQLRRAALQLANERLPSLVDRLGHGEPVDVATEAPPLPVGQDELGQVAQAFNAAQETAVRTAVEQAELRRGVREVFLSLARRTQALLHRQLNLLDAMERREDDPEELEDLFRVDHLATRMRRNAENLIVLSGATPGRSWRRNVPMYDVLRGAVAEVEDYARVTVLPVGPVELAGRAVGDVIHLLAELIENALSFSPPHTAVQVSGELVTNGYAIEIEDRGLGMPPEDRAAANERLSNPQEFTLSAAAQLGLFVVSRLSQRHGVRVRLKESPYGGVTAVVLIPRELVTERGGDGGEPAAPARQLVAARVPGGTATGDRPGPDVASRSATTAPDRGDPDRLPERRRTTRPARKAAPAAGGPPAVSTDRPPVDATAPRADAAPARAGGATPAKAAQPDTPAPGGPVRPSGNQQPELTPSGLPVRVRQANLAPPLREASARPTQPEQAEEERARSPEQIRRLMSSYQSGTRRGRSDAARGPDEPTPPPPAPAGT